MADYGMPVHRHPEMKGNLYIEFEVEFPEGLSCETAEVRRTLICKRLLYCMQECACIECFSSCVHVPVLHMCPSFWL